MDKNIDIKNDFSPQEQSPYVHVLIIRGSFDEPIECARMKLLRRACYPRRGWELKDCVAMGLPQEFRFELVKEVRQISKNGQDGFILLIE